MLSWKAHYCYYITKYIFLRLACARVYVWFHLLEVFILVFNIYILLFLDFFWLWEFYYLRGTEYLFTFLLYFILFFLCFYVFMFFFNFTKPIILIFQCHFFVCIIDSLRVKFSINTTLMNCKVFFFLLVLLPRSIFNYFCIYFCAPPPQRSWCLRVFVPCSQGAGGNGNVLKEIVEPAGATYDIRKVWQYR